MLEVCTMGRGRPDPAERRRVEGVDPFQRHELGRRARPVPSRGGALSAGAPVERGAVSGLGGVGLRRGAVPQVLPGRTNACPGRRGAGLSRGGGGRRGPRRR